jgi:4-amino-4-deoxy-L-arabinose transferase-like glycosyltransferase
LNEATNRAAWAAWTARWSATLTLVGAVTLARLVYLALLCPYALIEDEAHYWEWSRHLDWSYYSKGPGIAWVIAASTRVLGDIAGMAGARPEFAVRVPTVLAAAVTAIAVAGLAREAMGDRRAGFYAAVCFMLAPIYQISAVLMTIDMPYLGAWALVCWGAWRVLGRDHPGSTGAWAALGAALAIGFLFKYTILLLIPGLVLFAWLDRRGGRAGRLPASGVLVAVAVASLGLAPVLIWNAGRGWPTVFHLLGHLGLASGDVPAKDQPASAWHYNPRWTLDYLAIQAVVLGPVLYLGLAGAARAQRTPGSRTRRGAVFLLCCALPILLFYLAVTLFSEVEGNWPIAGYITLLPLAGWAATTASRGPTFHLWRASLWTGVVVGLFSLRLDWVAASPPAAWLDRGLQAIKVKGSRPLIPVGRLMPAPIFAADAARLASELRDRTGLEPFYVCEHYGGAGLLAFYIPGHPTVYCSSSQTGEGRRTQYDYWPDTDLSDLALLGGRPAVCLGKNRQRWEGAFERVEERARLAADPKDDRLVFLGFGYRGFGYRDATPAGK